MRTYSERDPAPADYDGFAVRGFQAFAPPIPFLRNYVRNERLYARLSRYLIDVIKNEKIDLIHGQHVLTGPPSVVAGRRAGIPSLCTVRDYWPVCYWGDVLANPDAGVVCPGCSPTAMTRCLRPRPDSHGRYTANDSYMRANLRNKQGELESADVIVAVSRYVAAACVRGSGTRRARIETIRTASTCRASVPNQMRCRAPMSDRYAVFVESSRRTKACTRSSMSPARLGSRYACRNGDGAERQAIEQAAAAARRDVRILGWRDRRECSSGCATRS